MTRLAPKLFPVIRIFVRPAESSPITVPRDSRTHHNSLKWLIFESLDELTTFLTYLTDSKVLIAIVRFTSDRNVSNVFPYSNEQITRLDGIEACA